MKIGYARVSTQDQNLDLQIDALREAGCEKIFQEKVSGMKADRVELARMLEQVRDGDTIVIWKLDRLGRSLQHLIQLVGELNDRGVGLVSLNDPIDTTTAQGMLVFNIFASLNEFQVSLTRERTNAGLQSARARGRVGGRKPGLSEENKVKAVAAESLYREGKLSTAEICSNLSISKPTLYRWLKERGVEISGYRKRVN